jgi:hypothetical protein
MWLANWWDGADLWLSQLAFPFQFAIVIAVLGPVCYGLAWVIDRAVDVVSGRIARRSEAHVMTTTAPEPTLVGADVPVGTLLTAGPPDLAQADVPTAADRPRASADS